MDKGDDAGYFGCWATTEDAKKNNNSGSRRFMAPGTKRHYIPDRRPLPFTAANTVSVIPAHLILRIGRKTPLVLCPVAGLLRGFATIDIPVLEGRRIAGEIINRTRARRRGSRRTPNLGRSRTARDQNDRKDWRCQTHYTFSRIAESALPP